MNPDATFDFNEIVDRRGTASTQWEKYPGRDVIPLWLADMDFRSPPAVIAALRRRVEHGVFGYTSVPPELVDAVRSMLLAAYGWEVQPEWLVWLPGLVTGLNVVCRAAAAPGEEVLTAVPVYPPFLTAPQLSRRALTTLPLIRAGGRWTFDFERLPALITPRTRLFLLCNPHNPVGRVFSREELARLAAICAAHDLIICSDEIHCGLVLDPDKAHVPIAALDPAVARRTVTFMSPSKTFNLAGLGCAFAIIPDKKLRRRFRDTMAGIVPGVNLFGFTAALAAYRDGAPWQAALLAYLRGNRQLVQDTVNRMPGLTMHHVEATYLAWIDTRESGIADPVPLFAAAGVGLADGADFGAPGWVRLSFACPRATLTAALARMSRALARAPLEEGRL